VLEWDTDDDDVFADVPSATRITHVSLVGGLGHRACVIRCADHRGITVSRRQKEVATLAEGLLPRPHALRCCTARPYAAVTPAV